MSESGFSTGGVTQPEVRVDVREVQAGPPPAASGSLTVISTIANLQATSLPVALPDLRAPSGVASEGFIFRIGPGTQVVAVRFDTQQVQERERVRKANEALRRSTQG
jgi:hypothetical protein